MNFVNMILKSRLCILQPPTNLGGLHFKELCKPVPTARPLHPEEPAPTACSPRTEKRASTTRPLRTKNFAATTTTTRANQPTHIREDWISKLDNSVITIEQPHLDDLPKPPVSNDNLPKMSYRY